MNDWIYEIAVLKSGWDRSMPVCEATNLTIAVDVVRSLLSVRDPDLSAITINIRVKL